MAVAAAQRALVSAGLADPATVPRERFGCVFGSDYMLTIPDDFTTAVARCQGADGQFAFDRWGEEGLPAMTPLWLLKYLPNMPASHIAIFNDLRGPSNSLTVREASGHLAVGEATITIGRGAADVMLVGSTGTRIHPMKMVHAILNEEVATGDDDPASWSRPFDRERRGMVLGEGAGVLIASSPVAAVTTIRSGLSANNAASPSCTTSWSSMTATEIGVSAPMEHTPQFAEPCMHAALQ